MTNARPHTAIVTRQFLEQNNVPVLPWPARSPDCNPIEHMWDELGRRLRQRLHAPNNVNELTQALQQEYGTIFQDFFIEICALPWRVEFTPSYRAMVAIRGIDCRPTDVDA